MNPGTEPPPRPDGIQTDLAQELAEYRSVREQIERHILPLATSLDGYGFGFQASLHDLALRRGCYVVVGAGEAQRLGQVTDLRIETVEAHSSTAGGGHDVRLRLATGSGTVLAGAGRSFHDEPVRAASPEEVGAWWERARTPGRAALPVGELVHAPGVPAVLDAVGFNRHTFMCGQSGSGKTYSLGLVLEQILAETTLRVVVLDPNSDYVGLGRVRDGAPPERLARYARVPSEVSVWTNDAAGDHPLRLQFADLSSAAQAAVLDLDPVRDRDEYAVLADLLRQRRDGRPLVSGIDQLFEMDTPGARALGLRASNLGVLDWPLWDPVAPSLVKEIGDPSARCTVVDLGSLGSLQEQRTVAQAVLSALWEARASRIPCLVVIDEAHNICPTDPPDRTSGLAADLAVQIAAEGRKYGLHLLVSTQRPGKVPENVVSQCDNLLLMRMNSRADLGDLERLFSFVPSGLMAGATSFRLGQVLVAGRVLSQPAYVQMGERVSEEGGGDVATTWAGPGP
jgi:hypothetical protein